MGLEVVVDEALNGLLAAVPPCCLLTGRHCPANLMAQFEETVAKFGHLFLEFSVIGGEERNRFLKHSHFVERLRRVVNQLVQRFGRSSD